MAKDLHRSAKRQEIAAHNEGFLEGYMAGIASAVELLRSIGLISAANELERAKVVDCREAGK